MFFSDPLPQWQQYLPLKLKASALHDLVLYFLFLFSSPAPIHRPRQPSQKNTYPTVLTPQTELEQLKNKESQTTYSPFFTCCLGYQKARAKESFHRSLPDHRASSEGSQPHWRGIWIPQTAPRKFLIRTKATVSFPFGRERERESCFRSCDVGGVNKSPIFTVTSNLRTVSVSVSVRSFSFSSHSLFSVSLYSMTRKVTSSLNLGF